MCLRVVFQFSKFLRLQSALFRTLSDYKEHNKFIFNVRNHPNF